MALRGASTTTDVDFIDWESLGQEGAAVLCSVLEIEEEMNFGNGPVQPVRARVIILTGKQAGKVYSNERIMKAGIRNRLQEVGDDVVGRMSTYTRGKKVYPCLNDEADGDIELAEAALREHGPAAFGAKTEDSGDEPPF